ncbi:hypothetical protein N9O25_01165 [Flavobacteriaceae bacterium]|nr:hypothetical protein [Flavobacteriaceae bacterium]
MNKTIDATVFNHLEKDFEILENHHLDKSIRDNIPSVSGYVPYLKNLTKIYYYHFFSINYGIRKTFIGQLSLIDEKDVVKKTIVLKLPNRFNGVINLNDIFKDLEGTSCILEVFHPRINHNHAGNQGHLRFWGVYGDDTSTVHSMPLFPFMVKNDIPKLAERRFYPKLSKKTSNYFINANLKKKSIHDDLEGDLSSSKKLLSGFTIQMKKNASADKLDYPSGIWHHSQFTRNDFLKLNGIIENQVVSFPYIKRIDAIMFFGEFTTADQNIEFTLYNTLEKKIIQQKTITVDIDKQLKASSLFDLNALEGNCIIVSPKENSGNNIFKSGYTNIQYIIEDNICDGVHAHRFTSDKTGQGLKFMHYKINDQTNSYFSIWSSKSKKIYYRLRIFDSQKTFEKCFSLSIENDEVVQCINLGDLDIPFGSGIIQLECDTHNPSATSFIHKQYDGHSFLSVCHLTGG